LKKYTHPVVRETPRRKPKNTKESQFLGGKNCVVGMLNEAKRAKKNKCRISSLDRCNHFGACV